MKKIKVIQVNSSSSSLSTKHYEKDIFNGWYAQVAYQLKKAKKDLEIECWTPEKEYKKEQMKYNRGIKFRIFPSTLTIRNGMEISLKMIKTLKREIKKAKRLNYKLIIHFHEYHSWQVYLSLLNIKKDKNIKLIAQHHGGRSPLNNLIKYKRLILFLPAIILMQFSEYFLFKKINKFYALGKNEEKYLRNLAPKSEIVFQTMGIEDIYFKNINKSLARKKLGLKGNKKYVLYLGRIKSTKGIDELLRAMPSIDAELNLVGEGPDYEKNKKYILKNKIKNINFIGSKYGNEKILYLAASDCLILPSYTEGAPVVLMEAIAQNLPVVATNVGGIPEMIETNREGIIIKPKSISEIINSLKKILSWKKKDIRKYAEKYKWKNIIENTLKDYYQ